MCADEQHIVMLCICVSVKCVSGIITLVLMKKPSFDEQLPVVVSATEDCSMKLVV